MKLSRSSSCIVLALLCIASSYVAANSLHTQAERESELSASLVVGHGVTMGRHDDFGFEDHLFNPGRPGAEFFQDNPARPGSGFMLNQPIRR
ncbi:hypothetical protein FH968_01565 [Buttiauxella sp. B2]|nr:hypothetical protein FH968_01565 [Buttiauxella sp. B2]